MLASCMASQDGGGRSATRVLLHTCPPLPACGQKKPTAHMLPPCLVVALEASKGSSLELQGCRRQAVFASCRCQKHPQPHGYLSVIVLHARPRPNIPASCSQRRLALLHARRIEKKRVGRLSDDGCGWHLPRATRLQGLAGSSPVLLLPHRCI